VQLSHCLDHILEVFGTYLQERGELLGLFDLPLPPVDGAYGEDVGAGREAPLDQRPGDSASGSLIWVRHENRGHLCVHTV